MSFSTERRKRLLAKKKPGRLANRMKADLKLKTAKIPKGIKPLKTDTTWLIKPTTLLKKGKTSPNTLLKLLGLPKTVVSTKKGGKVSTKKRRKVLRGWGKAQRGY